MTRIEHTYANVRKKHLENSLNPLIGLRRAASCTYCSRMFTTYLLPVLLEPGRGTTRKEIVEEDYRLFISDQKWNGNGDGVVGDAVFNILHVSLHMSDIWGIFLAVYCVICQKARWITCYIRWFPWSLLLVESKYARGKLFEPLILMDSGNKSFIRESSWFIYGWLWRFWEGGHDFSTVGFG